MEDKNMSDQTKKKILVVDDEQDLREALEAALLAAGYEVLTAADGVEGLQKALSEKPDLMLLDLQMPHMDGHEVMEKLLATPEGSHIKIIVLTALSGLDDVAVTIESGGFDYIMKNNINLEGILKKIYERLNY